MWILKIPNVLKYTYILHIVQDLRYYIISWFMIHSVRRNKVTHTQRSKVHEVFSTPSHRNSACTSQLPAIFYLGFFYAMNQSLSYLILTCICFVFMTKNIDSQMFPSNKEGMIWVLLFCVLQTVIFDYIYTSWCHNKYYWKKCIIKNK